MRRPGKHIRQASDHGSTHLHIVMDSDLVREGRELAADENKSFTLLLEELLAERLTNENE